MLTVTFNPALDISASVSAMQPDRKMYCADVVFDAGGGGVNVARVAQRLGAAATAVVFVDPDSSGRFLALLQAENVACEVVRVAGPLRDSFAVLDGSSTRQYRFVLPGPQMKRAHLDAGVARIIELSEEEPIVAISGSLPPGVGGSDVAALVDRLRSKSTNVIVDISGDVLRAVAKVGATLIKPSVNELSVHAGQTLSSRTEIEHAAHRLLATGPNGAALVSMGSAGAMLVRPNDTTLWMHAPHVHPVSTVGAGDSLVAGVAVALQNGATLVDAARLGVAAGSAATLATGTGLCQQSDVDRLLPEVLVTPLTT